MPTLAYYEPTSSGRTHAYPPSCMPTFLMPHARHTRLGAIGLLPTWTRLGITPSLRACLWARVSHPYLFSYLLSFQYVTPIARNAELHIGGRHANRKEIHGENNHLQNSWNPWNKWNQVHIMNITHLTWIHSLTWLESNHSINQSNQILERRWKN